MYNSLFQYNTSVLDIKKIISGNERKKHRISAPRYTKIVEQNHEVEAAQARPFFDPVQQEQFSSTALRNIGPQ